MVSTRNPDPVIEKIIEQNIRKEYCASRSSCSELLDAGARIENLEKLVNNLLIEIRKWSRITAEKGCEINTLKGDLKNLRDNIHQMTGTRRLLRIENQGVKNEN